MPPIRGMSTSKRASQQHQPHTPRLQREPSSESTPSAKRSGRRSHGGQISVLKKWDERKLAYEVNGNKRGTYFLALFTVGTAVGCGPGSLGAGSAGAGVSGPLGCGAPNGPERTVKAHMSAIFEKLGVRNRTQAGVVLRELELSDPARLMEG